mmetsp:Transcript_11859/g.19984  ORF Transcript_11859/g.19984 Transcript_11859/m.19984 type:complete len:93 (-) Transcript_11859:382-660(-)
MLSSAAQSNHGHSLCVRTAARLGCSSQPSCDLRTILRQFLLKASKSVLYSFAAAILAGDSKLGSPIIEMTEMRMDSTVWMGSQRSLADSYPY